MTTEGIDASEDMERKVSQQEEGAFSPWQAFYDDSVEPSIPLWYNSATGESNWECPSNREKEEGMKDDGLRSTSAAGKGAVCTGPNAREGCCKTMLYCSFGGEEKHYLCMDNGRVRYSKWGGSAAGTGVLTPELSKAPSVLKEIRFPRPSSLDTRRVIP